jgi:hypothetical protein
MNNAALIEEFDVDVSRFHRRRRADQPKVETYSYVSPANVMVQPPSVLPLFSFVLEDTVVYLRHALMLRIATEDGEYYVENDALKLFGNGPTLGDAVHALTQDFAYYSEYYRGLQGDEVVGDGMDLKRRYESLVSA